MTTELRILLRLGLFFDVADLQVFEFILGNGVLAPVFNFCFLLFVALIWIIWAIAIIIQIEGIVSVRCLSFLWVWEVSCLFPWWSHNLMFFAFVTNYPKEAWLLFSDLPWARDVTFLRLAKPSKCLLDVLVLLTVTVARQVVESIDLDVFLLASVWGRFRPLTVIVLVTGRVLQSELCIRDWTWNLRVRAHRQTMLRYLFLILSVWRWRSLLFLLVTQIDGGQILRRTRVDCFHRSSLLTCALTTLFVRWMTLLTLSSKGAFPVATSVSGCGR